MIKDDYLLLHRLLGVELPLLENPYCPDEPVVVDHQAGWMI